MDRRAGWRWRGDARATHTCAMDDRPEEALDEGKQAQISTAGATPRSVPVSIARGFSWRASRGPVAIGVAIVALLAITFGVLFRGSGTPPGTATPQATGTGPPTPPGTGLGRPPERPRQRGVLLVPRRAPPPRVRRRRLARLRPIRKARLRLRAGRGLAGRRSSGRWRRYGRRHPAFAARRLVRRKRCRGKRTRLGGDRREPADRLWRSDRRLVSGRQIREGERERDPARLVGRRTIPGPRAREHATAPRRVEAGKGRSRSSSSPPAGSSRRSRTSAARSRSRRTADRSRRSRAPI